MWRKQRWARNSGIGHYQRIDLVPGAQGGNVIYIGRLKVWRDFQENRRPRRSPLHHYGSEQGVECALVLQRAQTGRVGGTDVDGQIIRQGRHVAHARRIISRSEEHTSELQSLMRISYAVFCLKKKKKLQISI